ncbi:MAG: family 78 glycoside hydrolase catalytic domain [Candidatus Sulfotelmatobacter sp.]
MKGFGLASLVISFVVVATAVFAEPVRLRCEYLENPMGLDVAAPHLSWQSDSAERNWRQTSYEILVASSEESLRAGKADVWGSGKVDSAESIGIAYGGPALESRKRYYWRVRVWDAGGGSSESAAAWWEMGLLHPTDWKAKWIHWKNPDDEADRQGMRWIWLPGQDALAVVPKTAATFRVTVKLSEKAKEAVLLFATRGDFVAKVNGHEVDAKSRWSTFECRDISDELVVGQNSIEVTVTAPEPPDFGPNAGAKTTMAALTALVKIAGASGKMMRFPTNEKWEATLENTSAWKSAQVVGELTDKRLGDPGELPQPAAYLRRTLALSKNVQSARLYVTALGSYRVFLNGRRVGGDVLTPDFTDYRKRVLYQTYDVTSFMVNGDNVIGAVLGDGWYGSGLTWVGMHFFPPPDRFVAQLELDYADGSHDTIVTDESWKAAESPIVRSDIYGGEVYDARREQTGWEKSGFDDSKWKPAVVASAPAVVITSQITAPPRVIARLDAKSVTPLANGAYIFDMGQNMVGWATLKVKGAAGTKVRMRFAEVLNPDGTIYTANLRNADATDVYTLRGDGEETFAPHFTFHGFRYVEMTGYPGTPGLDAIEGEVVSSVSENPAAKLVTSSALVNQMWSIGLWGQRGNFLSIPTDCPQRDERLGLMGDAAVFWRTGSYNFDVAAFSQKFIQDIVDAQSRQGAFRNVSPNTLPSSADDADELSLESDKIGAPGWGDAGVIVPWTTWVQYGDKAVIEKNWDAMQRWMEFIGSRNPDFLRTRGVGPNFADWLAPDEHTNKDLLATAYWALIANMMSQMAHAVGKEADAKRYDEVVRNIRVAFQQAYIKDDGTVGTGTQTSYVVALYTKMAPAALERLLVDKLVKDIEERNWHLSTGFLGTPFLLFTLADHGRSDVAYRLLMNETYPSWGYMLSKGATTWWERWNGDTGDPAMNSYNHYAFGSVMAWVYRYAAGIDTTPDAPGFKEVVIHPHLDARLTSARAKYESVYGTIVSDWKGTAAGPFSLTVTIPANTSAKVFLPAMGGAHLTEDGNPVNAQAVDGSFVVTVGSGSYSFEVK